MNGIGIGETRPWPQGVAEAAWAPSLPYRTCPARGAGRPALCHTLRTTHRPHLLGTLGLHRDVPAHGTVTTSLRKLPTATRAQLGVCRHSLSQLPGAVLDPSVVDRLL